MKLINRCSAIMALKKQMFDGTDYRNEIVGQCIDAIKGLKVHDSKERKTGKWIRVDSNTFKCSACGNFLNFNGVNAGRGDANYCPNCGAKMEVDENEIHS